MAEKIYELEELQMELFYKCNEILGCERSNSSDFPIWDIGTDSYDNSLEIALSEKHPELTREQIDQMLDIGFGWIYVNQGDVAHRWSRSNCHSCSPHTFEGEISKIIKYRNRIDELEKIIDELK